MFPSHSAVELCRCNVLTHHNLTRAILNSCNLHTGIDWWTCQVGLKVLRDLHGRSKYTFVPIGVTERLGVRPLPDTVVAIRRTQPEVYIKPVA